ncbi:MarR family winged helix-turn-helix transcriptional regulator [Propionibacterium freudenreichii]|uniref:MarR family winged helix-turn-helix transcriptional regulator n=2 Tax=Propionibacterium freudenreichii TaxID=1744 RepID=UPI00254BC566|nr:MarR family winged helix-turn-helix transcriptional regulator [Propionibacterium freudenreichii]MDK9301677.1 winged helix-turn-helix transcriptional regulator [Propionibacterium freudenreichii]MDK9340669.1 winged helix-turn-helix transcriptional regulator [Propionibacterium freudenreichii]MDK9648998.1 winged helix-turn-helix transcriptional regulator [Propionibacterium freudenreichii]
MAARNTAGSWNGGSAGRGNAGNGGHNRRHRGRPRNDHGVPRNASRNHRSEGYDPRGNDVRGNDWWNDDPDRSNASAQPFGTDRADRPDWADRPNRPNRPDRPTGSDLSGRADPSHDSDDGASRGQSGSQPDVATNVTGRLVYLFALMRQSEAQLRRDRGGRGVMEGQGRVLHMLALHSPIAQKELSYLLGIRPQSLGELLGKLEESGQIARHPDPDDRRAQVVEITARGRAADSDRPAAPDDPFAVLDPDQQREFVTLLDQVIDGLEASIPGGIDRHLQTMRRVWVDNDGWDPEAGPSSGPYQGRGPGFGWPGGRGRRRN